MYSEEEMIQNMKDAGCGDDCIREFLEGYRKGANKKCEMILSIHRRELLDRIHQQQCQIDCLDYLSYRLMQNRKEKEAERLEE